MLAAVIQMYRRMMTAARRSSAYRPERHYMRGAGPASRRKSAGPSFAEDGRKRANAAQRKEADQARQTLGPSHADQA